MQDILSKVSAHGGSRLNAKNFRSTIPNLIESLIADGFL